MAKVTHDNSRAPLLAEAIRARAERETGDERLAWIRTRKDIAAERVTVTAETLNGAPFELPPGGTWANATYYPRKSKASWLIGTMPVWAWWADKVKPRDTRKSVVAYCVRIQAPVDAPPSPETGAVKNLEPPHNKAATTKPEPPGRPGDTEGERRARVFLYGVMARNPSGLPGKTKPDFERVCLKRFKIAARRFHAIWDDCKADSGAKGYGKPGPRGPHKPNKSPSRIK